MMQEMKIKRLSEEQELCACGEEGQCDHIATERNRYFTGKYMAARDFTAEQDYFLSRHRLHNRLLHGWGIVCGLAVSCHPSAEQKPDPNYKQRITCSPKGANNCTRWVRISPGIALDCCGRELVVEKDIFIELPLLDEPRVPETQKYGNSEEQDRNAFLIGLRYREDGAECVPVLYTEGKCDPHHQEANRVREAVEVVYEYLDQVDGDCWRDTEPNYEACGRNDCGDEPMSPTGTCLKPVCLCEGMVPLALITPGPRYSPTSEYSGISFNIDSSGRRRLPTPSHLLTRIVGTNWIHGSQVPISALRAQEGRLEITFDRKLQDVDRLKLGTGINENTFVVQWASGQRQLEFLNPESPDTPGNPSNPKLDQEHCRAVFKIDSSLLRRTLIGSRIYVTLKCDFILDCHDNAVDGNFLGAKFPTGDGVQGGTFESWFDVVPDARGEEGA
jgi:hypothetical protein